MAPSRVYHLGIFEMLAEESHMIKRFMKALAVVAVAVLATLALTMPAEAKIPDKAPDVTLYGIDGSTETLNGTYGGTNRIVIVANLCGNAQSTVYQAAALSEKPEYSSINFLILGTDVSESQFAGEYADLQNSTLRLFYKDRDYYSDWGYEVYRMDPTYNDIHSFEMPFVFVIDQNDNVCFVDQTRLQDFPALIETYFGIANPDFTTVDVCGYVSTETGMELLSLVNEARAAVGSPALVWDADLAETAIQRSMEIAIEFDHERPNSEMCYTAWPAWSYSSAENIASGQQTCAEVNESWTNSEGHYANMIDPDMASFAAALYVNDIGMTFWVECFSGDIGPNGEGSIVMGDMTRTVPLDLTQHGFAVCGYYERELETTDTYQLDGTKIGWANLASSVNWETSDSAIVTVSDNGLVTALSVGEASVTATVADNPKLYHTVKFTVETKGISYKDAWLDATTFIYTGSPICPDVTVIVNGKTLKKDVDYTLAYEKNVSAGSASVRVAGTGNYAGGTTLYYTINRASLESATLTVADQTYTGDELTPLPTVVLGEQTLKAGIDFEVYHSNNIAAGEGAVTVYGIGNYTGYATKLFNINKASIKYATIGIANQTYSGKALTPDVTVMLNGKELERRVDFTVEYFDNTNVGTATVYVYGNGNYEGFAEGSFKITAVVHNPGWFHDKTTGVYYYFEKDGVTRHTGWLYDGAYYYFDSDGKLVVNGWAIYDGKRYYMGTSALLAKNTWAQVDGEWYYIGSNYQPVTKGWAKVGSTYYYMDANGHVTKTGWASYNGKYYYIENYKVVVNDWRQVSGTWYHFNKSGVCDRVWNG